MRLLKQLPFSKLLDKGGETGYEGLTLTGWPVNKKDFKFPTDGSLNFAVHPLELAEHAYESKTLKFVWKEESARAVTTEETIDEPIDAEVLDADDDNDDENETGDAMAEDV